MTNRRKIPTKAELEQLQKLYKTDEKIGERLGGVPAYLVAYWRRKKNIPKYSLPKFSQQEICNLWERFGDDEKAGLELGISKAAFYNWRRRYGYREKPDFLKLEQLELNFPGSRLSIHSSSLYGKRTMAQKILSQAGDVEEVAVGDVVEVEPDVVVLRGSSSQVVDQFKSKGVEYVWNPNKIIITTGLGTLSNGDDQLSSNRMISEFAKRQSIRNFYDLRDGICPNVVIEKGIILPGTLVLGVGGQETAYGCLSALGTTIDDTAMAALWATGKHSLKVPATAQVLVNGRRHRGVHAVDVALSVIDKLGEEDVQGLAIEFAGSTVSQMTLSERFTISNMSKEIGIAAAICSYDATTRRYLVGRTSGRSTPVIPDKDADYAEMYQINVDQLLPQIAGPGDVGNVRPVAEREGLTINQVILGSCASGRFDELRIAAEVLKGKRVHPDCRMLVIPGSRSIFLETLKKGLIRVFVEAGAMVLNPCSCPCQGTPHGNLAAGERCLTTSDSHLENYLGSPDAELFYCSPATAAASALNAAVTEPTRYMK